VSIPVVLASDAETDDAIAILLAARHRALDLLGVSTASAEEAATLRELTAVVGDVGVHAGADRLAAMLRAAAEPVTLVTTGPLTHLAAALDADRSLARAVRRLVVVGGAHREPGVTAHAERNVWTDPDAAAAVLAAPFRDVLLVTADATASVALDGADLDRLRGLRTSVAAAAADLAATRLDRGARVHDPLGVAALVEPGLLTTLRAAVRVERADPETYGATRFAAELDEQRGRVTVAVRADKRRYVDLLCAAFS
jgi:inosine-uridine nucleoside N-ribohydrolase